MSTCTPSNFGCGGGRAARSRGGSVGRPRCARILRTPALAVTTATIFIRPRHLGHSRTSTRNTRFSRTAHRRRPNLGTRLGSISRGSPDEDGRVEAEAREPDQEEGQPDDGEEESYSASKGENLSLKSGTIDGEDIGGDDEPRAAPNPADRGRAWDTEVMEQARVTLLAEEVAHTVVAGTAASGGRHGAW